MLEMRMTKEPSSSSQCISTSWKFRIEWSGCCVRVVCFLPLPGHCEKHFFCTSGKPIQSASVEFLPMWEGALVAHKNVISSFDSPERFHPKFGWRWLFSSTKSKTHWSQPCLLFRSPANVAPGWCSMEGWWHLKVLTACKKRWSKMCKKLARQLTATDLCVINESVARFRSQQGVQNEKECP